MELKEIKQILKLMDDHCLAEFTLEKDDTKLIIKSQHGASQMMAPAAAPVAPVAPIAPAVAPVAPATPVEPVVDDSLEVITSPMIGTFYSASGPDSAPFVCLGDTVSDDSTVCIIEAMKIMNEIKSEISGTIVEMCVSNGQTVEFGQPLFKVKNN